MEKQQRKQRSRLARIDPQRLPTTAQLERPEDAELHEQGIPPPP